jgi:hypothetical protein
MSNRLKWWTIDFHTHTPASDDYGKLQTKFSSHIINEFNLVQ